MSHREHPRKILKFLRAKGGQTGVDLFSNFQKHHFRPLLGRLFHKPQVRLDHRRYLTLSDSLGWDPEKNHEFSEAVQRVVQEMGVWFMG
jgi:hypothetical protein